MKASITQGHVQPSIINQLVHRRRQHRAGLGNTHWDRGRGRYLHLFKKRSRDGRLLCVSSRQQVKGRVNSSSSSETLFLVSGTGNAMQASQPMRQQGRGQPVNPSWLRSALLLAVASCSLVQHTVDYCWPSHKAGTPNRAPHTASRTQPLQYPWTLLEEFYSSAL